MLGLLRGNHRLSLQGGDLRDFTGHRRHDLRVVEVGFRRIQRGLIAFNLRVDGANLRLFTASSVVAVSRSCCEIACVLASAC
jgi:hypothetical protein